MRKRTNLTTIFQWIKFSHL